MRVNFQEQMFDWYYTKWFKDSVKFIAYQEEA